ncbi:hypothetical protein [Streptomyces zaomyceticus]|uniref:hypothetical protein n=1 Tax=Streptomyces zaomyceticus TaxID=68286 RepID=UPI0036C2C3E3
MTKAWKRGSAALAAGAIIAVGMVATQPAPSASAAKGTTARKLVASTKAKTIRLMVCDKGMYPSVFTVQPQDPVAQRPNLYKRHGERCYKADLDFNKTYKVSVMIVNMRVGRIAGTIKTFSFKADRPMTVVTLGTAQKPRLERYRK